MTSYVIQGMSMYRNYGYKTNTGLIYNTIVSTKCISDNILNIMNPAIASGMSYYKVREKIITESILLRNTYLNDSVVFQDFDKHLSIIHYNNMSFTMLFFS
jgi:hypothetical protein